MTFEERCERFVKNSAKEHNRYRFVYRVIFLNKKIEEHEKEEMEFQEELPKKERPKDHAKARLMLK